MLFSFSNNYSCFALKLPPSYFALLASSCFLFSPSALSSSAEVEITAAGAQAAGRAAFLGGVHDFFAICNFSGVTVNVYQAPTTIHQPNAGDDGGVEIENMFSISTLLGA